MDASLLSQYHYYPHIIDTLHVGGGVRRAAECDGLATLISIVREPECEMFSHWCSCGRSALLEIGGGTRSLAAGIPFSMRRLFGRVAIHMLGEMVGELTGKVVGKRISYHYAGDLKIERTMESKGILLGKEVALLATFWSKERSQGGMLAKGNGIITTGEGEMAVLQGSGISVPAKGPGWSMRGIRYLQTGGASLSRLNNVALLFEIEIAPDGTVSDRMWEWK